MDDGNFNNWLIQKFKYEERSARDVRSRVKRAGKLVDISEQLSDEELIFKLSQHPSFKDMSTSVKSQLKRGVKLYREFVRESNSEYRVNGGSSNNS